MNKTLLNEDKVFIGITIRRMRKLLEIKVDCRECKKLFMIDALSGQIGLNDFCASCQKKSHENEFNYYRNIGGIICKLKQEKINIEAIQ